MNTKFAHAKIVAASLKAVDDEKIVPLERRPPSGNTIEVELEKQNTT